MMVRNRFFWTSVAMAYVTTLSGCGSNVHSSNPPVVVQSSGHIARIYPTARGTEMASAPAANGVMWVLAGTSHAQALYPLELTARTVEKGIPLNASTNAVGRLPAGPLFTAEGGSHPQLVWRSPISGQRTGTLSLPGVAVSLAAGQGGRHVYALCLMADHTESVVVIDTGNKPNISATWNVPSNTISLAPTPSARHLYTLSTNGQVNEWSLRTHQMTSQFSVGQSGRSLIINLAGTTLYALKGRHHIRNIAVVPLATESVSHVLAAPAYARQIVMPANGREIYVVVGNHAYGNIQEITGIGGHGS